MFDISALPLAVTACQERPVPSRKMQVREGGVVEQLTEPLQAGRVDGGSVRSGSGGGSGSGSETGRYLERREAEQVRRVAGLEGVCE